MPGQGREKRKLIWKGEDMQEFEKLGMFYLGKELDPETGKRGQDYLLYLSLILPRRTSPLGSMSKRQRRKGSPRRSTVRKRPGKRRLPSNGYFRGFNRPGGIIRPQGDERHESGQSCHSGKSDCVVRALFLAWEPLRRDAGGDSETLAAITGSIAEAKF